ncbi:hypothetical protein [Streptomyces sp. NPDC001415]
MKQSAKTLGVVALGAAFAAAAAGTASASTLPHFGPLSTVAAGAPVGTVGTVGKALPAAAHKSLTGKPLSGQQQEASDPVGSLLGGMPTGPVANNLSGAATLPGGLTG